MYISRDIRKAKRVRTMRNQKIRWFIGDLIGALCLFGSCYALILILWAFQT